MDVEENLTKREKMKELITIAFRQVRGVREIYLPEESSIVFSNLVENLREVLTIHNAIYLLIGGSSQSFHLMFSGERWIGVTTDNHVSEVLIRAALERAIKFLEKHSQVEQRIKYIQKDIEEFFQSVGMTATVRKVDLSIESDSLSGKIQLSTRKGRAEAVREQLHQFLEDLLPYFIKNKVHIIIERQSLLDRITRDQLLKIIRRVERL